MCQTASEAEHFEEETRLRDEVASIERNVGFGHLDTALPNSYLAMFLRREDRLEEAETIFQHVLEVYEENYGYTHPDVAMALDNLALVLGLSGHSTEAEAMAVRALALAKDYHADDEELVQLLTENHKCLREELVHPS